jgi:calcineurin-like phosphoesterase family protein
MRLNIDVTQGKNPSNVFFTSDFHLFHNNVLKFDNRPFADVHEMHQALEDNWNSVVGPDDIVIYLGDLSFARKQDAHLVEGILWRLNGKIHFVMGNHDDWRVIPKITRFESVQDYLEVRIAHYAARENSNTLVRTETLFCCMHYPIYSWNKAHHGSFMIHGHCHGNLHHGEDANFYVNRKVIDVGCNLHNYTPVSYLTIMDKLKDVVLPNLKDRVNN